MHLNPKTAAHILREHNITGKRFREFQVATQMGVMADILSKQSVGPFTRQEFLNAAAIMEWEESRKNKETS